MASVTAVMQPCKILTQITESTANTNTNESPKKVSKGHRCYFCGKRFMDKNILRKHVSIHKDRDHPCDVCNKAFSSRWGLNKHMKTHTGEKNFLCDKCPKAFVQKGTLMHHIKTVHEGNTLRPYCKSCGKNLRSNAQQCWLCRYQEKDIPKDGIIPENPTLTLTSKIINSFSCDTEGLSMCIAEEMSQKGEVTTPVLFNNIPSGSSNLLYENAIETNKGEQVGGINNLYTCCHCNEVFYDLNTMKEHLHNHPDLDPHVCEICGKDFMLKTVLFRHMMSHKEERPYVCKLCKAPFKTIPCLKQHIVSHSEERPYACKECGTTFKALQSLKLHVLVHSKTKLLSCKFCSKTFNFVGNMQRHLRIHTGERPYVCKYCNKRFSQSSGLRAHEQIHQKTVKSVEEICSACGKKFKSLSNFKKHQQICC